jgi:hypothetical protein
MRGKGSSDAEQGLIGGSPEYQIGPGQGNRDADHETIMGGRVIRAILKRLVNRSSGSG